MSGKTTQNTNNSNKKSNRSSKAEDRQDTIEQQVPKETEKIPESLKPQPESEPKIKPEPERGSKPVSEPPKELPAQDEELNLGGDENYFFISRDEFEYHIAGIREELYRSIDESKARVQLLHKDFTADFSAALQQCFHESRMTAERFREEVKRLDSRLDKLEVQGESLAAQNRTFMNESPMIRGSPSLAESSHARSSIFHRPKAVKGAEPQMSKPLWNKPTDLNSDFDSDPERQEHNQRESILRRLSGSAAAPTHQITYTRVAPDFKHIYLEKLALGPLITFIERIFAYTTAYRLELPVTTLVSDRVRDQIMAHNTGLTWVKFHQLQVDRFIPLLLKEIKPPSALIFCQILADQVKMSLPSGYTPTPLNFKKLYYAILVYRDKFIRVYEILAENNKIENIPPCSNKEGGLIKLFLDGIPFQYGAKWFRAMKSSEFPDIYAFVKEYMKHVEADFERSKEANIMTHHFGGAALATKSWKSSSRPTEGHATQRFHEITAHTGHHDSDIEDSSDDFAADYKLGGSESDDSSNEHSDEPEQQLDAMDLKRKAPYPSKPLSTGKPKLPVKILQKGKGPDKEKGPAGCFQMLLHGSCEKGQQCPYSHDSGVLSRLHESYTERLKNSKYRPKGPSDRRVDSVAAVESVDSDLALMEQVDHFAHLSFSYSRDPAEDLAKAVHRKGSMLLPDGVILDITDALFDTGAVHASYIRKDFVDQHRHLLMPFRIEVHKKVQLADEVTVVPIDEAFNLCISFVDDTGTTHSASILFWVLPRCNHQVIIGLPAILRHFHDLHKHMLDVVVEQLESASSSAEVSHIHTLAHVGELRYPWTYVQEAIAPEDQDTPHPCSFPDALHYMEMSPEEALAEFRSQIPEHVNAEFAAAVPIIPLIEEKKSVFLHQNWNGIIGVDPVHLPVKAGMPTLLKPRARHVNPRIYPMAKQEFDRLGKYFYRESTSDIASCLVIAPKATKPFIRFCGDYVTINKYINTGHYPIPHVQHTLERIVRYKVFLDFDLANAFHQFRLSPETSALLSVQTPWGQYEPIFMPEGIGPASGILQKAMSDIFSDFQEWAIVIFDNLLVMATDYDDAYRKVELILDRCIKHNIFLKFSKTWLGFPEANFFGYVCRQGCYELSQTRKDAIYSLPFPHNMKQMQSFLGSAVFFKSFVPAFSSLAAPLYDMVRKDFSWDETTWGDTDYRKAFQDFKDALLAATAIFYPNYDYEWILRTDASRFGIGAVLLQVCPESGDTAQVLQPISFFSQKFSDQATRWSTIEQEAYAIFAAVRYFAYYLTCKPFILETDHNNLLYMEQSIVPKIVRWRVYLQSFSFLLRHIPGKENTVADWLSRLHERDMPTGLLQNLTDPPPSPESLLAQVHGGRMGHNGTRRTWLLLNKHFPGHRIPYRFVEDFVACCAICQKSRLGMTDCLQPIVRHLKPEHRRSMVGVDTLEVTPPDKNGFRYLVVIVNHFTKFSFLSATKTKDALTIAHVLFSYFALFGLVDAIISDPGSEYDNAIVEQLHRWLGVRHRFSLVQRHESNGVEGTNKQILRHLTALVFDERVLANWVPLLLFIQFMLNSTDNSETGVVPFHAHFGTVDHAYNRLPIPDSVVEAGDEAVSIDPEDFDSSSPSKLAKVYLHALDKNLAILYAISKDYQAKLVAERTKDTPPDKQNTYQAGDLVLWQLNPDDPLPTKLTPKFVGPFEVLEQVKNDVECRHVLHGYIKKFHVSRLKIFHGTKEKAKEVAQLDQDQHTIKAILAHRGDPANRTTMDFKVAFEDGDILWLAWSKDLFDSLPYESYCRNHPELTPLLHTVDLAKKFEQELAKTAITTVSPGDVCYVDLRYFGHLWYDSYVPFEDKDETLYLVLGRYYVWENKKHTKISIKFPVFKQTYVVDNVFIQRYAYRRAFPDTGAVLVDEGLVHRYPSLIRQSTSGKGGKPSSHHRI